MASSIEDIFYDAEEKLDTYENCQNLTNLNKVISSDYNPQSRSKFLKDLDFNNSERCNRLEMMKNDMLNLSIRDSTNSQISRTSRISTMTDKDNYDIFNVQNLQLTIPSIKDYNEFYAKNDISRRKSKTLDPNTSILCTKNFQFDNIVFDSCQYQTAPIISDLNLLYGISSSPNIRNSDPSIETNSPSNHSILVNEVPSQKHHKQTQSDISSVLPVRLEFPINNFNLKNDLDCRIASSDSTHSRSLFGNLLKKFKRRLPQSNDEDSDDDINLGHGVRVGSARNMRNRREFLFLRLIQDLPNKHMGAIWTMRFSPCGRLLATAGQDLEIRLWVLKQCFNQFKDIQPPQNISKVHNVEKRIRHHSDSDSFGSSMNSLSGTESTHSSESERILQTLPSSSNQIPSHRSGPFRSKPLQVWSGHESSVTELVWSKNLFLLSTGMDKMVRLWHVSQSTQLCIFSHKDTVPGVCFHPKDDRFFLSGSMDGMLRLWYIPEKRVHSSVQVPPVPSLLTAAASSIGMTTSNIMSSLSNSEPSSVKNITESTKVSKTLSEQTTIITCVAFALDGAKIVVGTYDGRVMFFTTDLVYITSISFKPYHGKINHCKVNGIELDPTDSSKILVTTSDSRARLVDSRDYHVVIKYRGMTTRQSRIKASFSPTGRYIICGSENHHIYLWRKEHDFVSRLVPKPRKDRNGFWESIRCHNDVVTCAIFSPVPNLILDRHLRRRFKSNQMNTNKNDTRLKNSDTNYQGEVIVSADCASVIKVYRNRFRLTS